MTGRPAESWMRCAAKSDIVHRSDYSGWGYSSRAVRTVLGYDTTNLGEKEGQHAAFASRGPEFEGTPTVASPIATCAAAPTIIGDMSSGLPGQPAEITRS